MKNGEAEYPRPPALGANLQRPLTGTSGAGVVEPPGVEGVVVLVLMQAMRDRYEYR